MGKLLDNCDIVANWTSSDDTNFTKSQDEADKQEGTGSIKVAASSDLLAALPLSANVKGYWKLENNGNDISGEDNHLIVTGGGYDPCKIGNGYHGDGIGTYLTNTNDYALGTIGTICLWFKPDVNVGADNHPADYIYFGRTLNTNLYWRIIKDGIGDAGRTLFYVPGSGGSVDLQYTAGTLYHMAVTWNGTSGFVMYRDAVNVANSSADVTDIGSTKIRFGWNAESGMLDGIFDEIIYWNAVLTQPQIEAVMNITGSCLNDYITRDLGA